MVLGKDFFEVTPRAVDTQIQKLKNAHGEIERIPIYQDFSAIYNKAQALAQNTWKQVSKNLQPEDIQLKDVFYQEVEGIKAYEGKTSQGLIITSGFRGDPDLTKTCLYALGDDRPFNIVVNKGWLGNLKSTQLLDISEGVEREGDGTYTATSEDVKLGRSHGFSGLNYYEGGVSYVIFPANKHSEVKVTVAKVLDIDLIKRALTYQRWVDSEINLLVNTGAYNGGEYKFELATSKKLASKLGDYYWHVGPNDYPYVRAAANLAAKMIEKQQEVSNGNSGHKVHILDHKNT